MIVVPTYTLAAAAQTELLIRKSRFIGLVMPMDSRASALQEIGRIRAQHRSATHVCWALLARSESGMSDDGEPSGTAGRPMLEVLRHHELDGVLAAVVRYYGGIRLGAGGLVRAYTDTVASALRLTRRIEHVACAEVTIVVAYADEAALRYWLRQQHYDVLGCEHDTMTRLRIRLPAANVDGLTRALPRLSHPATVACNPA